MNGMQELYNVRDERSGDSLRVSLLEGDRLEVAIEIEGLGERVLVLLEGGRRARELAKALARRSPLAPGAEVRL